jgi:hypothetical protein
MTELDVATALDRSLSKLIRIDTGAVSIATNNLRACSSTMRSISDPEADLGQATARVWLGV